MCSYADRVSLDAISPIGSSTPVSRVQTPAPSGAGTPGFAVALQRQLDQPRAEIAQVRATVSSMRNGGALLNMPGANVVDFASGPRSTPSSPAEVSAFLARHATGDRTDPYGWREMSRQIGDSVIGPGYGALFERQIQQESGFAPDVVTGQRVSSAGAEGIAQLMPQYYPHVNRRDPSQALHAGAQSMQQYLQSWNGDVRKAVASYNAGMGGVQSAVAAGGANWEAKLPQETRDYLSAILGTTRPMFSPGSAFGARAALPSIQSGLAGSLRALGGIAAPQP